MIARPLVAVEGNLCPSVARPVLESRGLRVGDPERADGHGLVARSGAGLARVPRAGRSALLVLPAPVDYVFVGKGTPGVLSALPEGGRVGVDGALRGRLLKVHRPDLDVVPLGSREEAEELVATGALTAWISGAHAPRHRPGERWMAEPLETGAWATAAGSGVLVLEVAGGPGPHAPSVADLDEPAARRAAEAELAVPAGLGLPGSAPVGVGARIHGSSLRLRAMVPGAVGRRLVRAEISGPAERPDEVGARMAELLVRRGALDLLGSADSAG